MISLVSYRTYFLKIEYKYIFTEVYLKKKYSLSLATTKLSTYTCQTLHHPHLSILQFHPLQPMHVL